jgi:hypothetical protein
MISRFVVRLRVAFDAWRSRLCRRAARQGLAAID